MATVGAKPRSGVFFGHGGDVAVTMKLWWTVCGGSGRARRLWCGGCVEEEEEKEEDKEEDQIGSDRRCRADRRWSAARCDVE
ncbi:hypothetical protein LWI29_009651 [Acer saccharum]|uniref:Uncharacterized protein n=1 Tax=Acer saccharum TaxID=4024 RepID=A0AA39T4J0_ACESA|nr:hypothetical protein LWI29_009651 [Acer saccharum]